MEDWIIIYLYTLYIVQRQQLTTSWLIFLEAEVEAFVLTLSPSPPPPPSRRPTSRPRPTSPSSPTSTSSTVCPRVVWTPTLTPTPVSHIKVGFFSFSSDYSSVNPSGHSLRNGDFYLMFDSIWDISDKNLLTNNSGPTSKLRLRPEVAEGNLSTSLPLRRVSQCDQPQSYKWVKCAPEL